MVKPENQCGKFYWGKRAGLKVKLRCRARRGHWLPCSWVN